MLILGSKSKARYELLKMYNAEIKVLVADIEEVFLDELSIEENVVNVAFEKAQALLEKYDIADDILVCADTVVLVNKQCLQKPKNYEEAFAMIKLLANKRVEVISGVYVKNKNDIHNFSETSFINFADIADEMITKYLKDNPSYIHISGALDIEKIKNYMDYTIEGSFSNIIGLPLEKVTSILYDSDAKEDISNETADNITVYRSSTRAIIEDDNKIILLKAYTFDKKHIFYYTIGGGYHRFEDKEDILKKEAMEEGGLVIDNLKPIVAVKEYNVVARDDFYNKMTVHSYYSANICGHCDVDYVEYEVELLLDIEKFEINEAIELIEKQYSFFKDTKYPVRAMSYSDLIALKAYRKNKYE